MNTTQEVQHPDNGRGFMPERTDVTEPPLSVEDVIELYKRFRRDGDHSSTGTTVRSRALDELSFLELFRLASLWHDVRRRPSPAGGDADVKNAHHEAVVWQNFYTWMQECLQERWVQQCVLTEAGGYISYRRLLGKHSRVGSRDYRREDDYPPCCDHTTLWRRKGRPPRFAEVLVTQPYWYDLDEMVAFAKEQDLWFWISERPAWHYPQGVFFIEWVNPGSQFARLRETPEADLSMRTIHAWRGKELAPGPGTVFTLLHPTTISRWRDDLDIHSLMRSELSRLSQLNDEASRAAH